MEPIDTGLFFEGVTCPHCEATIITGFDQRSDTQDALASEPGCDHVFLLAHDMGIAWISDDARAALAAAGIDVRDEDGLIELGDPDDDDDTWALVGRAIGWPEAQILATYAPGPSFDGTYVGVAPSHGSGR